MLREFACGKSAQVPERRQIAEPDTAHEFSFCVVTTPTPSAYTGNHSILNCHNLV